MNESMNDRGDCRIAPATPGLLISPGFTTCGTRKKEMTT